MDMGGHTRPLDLVSDFPAIPDGRAYLDTAATAQKPQAVIDAITRGYSETYATVHRGVYQRSADMTLAFEAARRRTAGFIGARAAEEVIFVRGATEGINLVPWQLVAQHTGAEIDVAPLTEDGRIDLDAMAAMLTERHKMVALAHVSNALGSVLDVRRAAALAHGVGALLLL